MKQITEKQERIQRLMVTPEIAAKWINFNALNNRTIRLDLVRRLARDMKAGKWMLNGSTIRFDMDGNLMDGQHRLLACIESGVSFATFVAYDLNSEVMSTIDTGAPRSNADILGIVTGMKNTRLMSSSAAWLWRYKTGNGFPERYMAGSASEIIEVINAHPGLEASAHLIINLRPMIAPSMAVFCHYIFAEQNRAKADLFFKQFVDGVGLNEFSPVLLLRNRLIANKANRQSKLSRHATLALIFRAWIAFRDDRPMKTLRGWSAQEEFPTI